MMPVARNSGDFETLGAGSQIVNRVLGPDRMDGFAFMPDTRFCFDVFSTYGLISNFVRV